MTLVSIVLEGKITLGDLEAGKLVVLGCIQDPVSTRKLHK